MVFGAILAGGIGRRMDCGELPKQFLLLGDKPILICSVEQFLKSERMDMVYIGVPSDWIFYTEELLKTHNIDKHKVQIIAGGADRNGTIMKIIDKIQEEFSVGDEDIIVTHDAARPFVCVKMLEESIDMAIKYGACDTVVPSCDTIITSTDGELINGIPQREWMYLGQTPQSFRMTLLKCLYEQLNDAEKATLTDACKIFYLRKMPIGLISGSQTNFKITTPFDYKFAQFLYEENKNNKKANLL